MARSGVHPEAAEEKEGTAHGRPVNWTQSNCAESRASLCASASIPLLFGPVPGECDFLYMYLRCVSVWPCIFASTILRSRFHVLPMSA